MRTTYTNPTYQLVEIVGGREYVLTGHGEFASGLAAREYARKIPRNNVWLVREARDCVRYGVVYGTRHEYVATV